MTNLKNAVTILSIGLLLGGLLSACGKHPSHVDAPEDVQNDTYPLVYPDPATDPKPTYPAPGQP